MLHVGKPSAESIASHLAQTHWHLLTHAYGPAVDVPEQILALLDIDPKIRQKALFGFTCNIFHQGTRYPATIHTVKPFMEMVRYQGMEDREGILDLLAILAVPWCDEPIENVVPLQMIDEANPFANESVDDEDSKGEASWLDAHRDNIVEQELSIRRPCYAEVAAGCEVYRQLLSDNCSPVAIAASKLLSLFPSHAYTSGEQLLQLYRHTDKHPLVKGAALISLAFLGGANVATAFRSEWKVLITDFTKNYAPASSNTVPFLMAVAAFCGMRDHDTRTPEVSRLVEVCIKNGIEEPPCDFYQTKEVPDEIENPDEYYESFLAPVASFPWSIEELIQFEIRNSIKTKADHDEQFDEDDSEEFRDELDEDEFDLQVFIDQIDDANDAKRANATSLMLLTHVFGEQYGMTFRDDSDRQFPIDDWDDQQRKILNAIAGCEMAWPEIAIQIQMAAELDFEPSRDELLEALGVASQSKGEIRKNESTDESLPVEPTDFSEPIVREAVKELYESFSLKRNNLSRALEKFAPYRPHSAVALDFLIEKLDSPIEKERESAAWALGRLGEFSASAADEMIKRFGSEQPNNYLALALEEIPLSPEKYGQLCDRLEHSTNVQEINAIQRVVGDNVSTERLKNWFSHPAESLRWSSIRMLAGRLNGYEFKPFLLKAMEDEATRGAASSYLEETNVAEWFFDELDSLPEATTHFILETMDDTTVDVSNHRDKFISAIERSTTVENQRASMVVLIAHFSKPTSDDANMLTRVGMSEEVSTRVRVIETLAQLYGNGFDSALDQAIIDLGVHNDSLVRETAVSALARFGQKGGPTSVALIAGLKDSDMRVRLAAAWGLRYRAPDVLAAEIEMLIRESGRDNDRLIAESIWALGNTTFADDLQARVEVWSESTRESLPMADSISQWLACQK